MTASIRGLADWRVLSALAAAFVPALAYMVADLTAGEMAWVVSLSLLAVVLLLGAALKAVADQTASQSAQIRAFSGHVNYVGEQLAALSRTVEGERSNLCRVADAIADVRVVVGGIGELRQALQVEQTNLGLVAGGLNELQQSMSALLATETE